MKIRNNPIRVFPIGCDKCFGFHQRYKVRVSHIEGVAAAEANPERVKRFTTQQFSDTVGNHGAFYLNQVIKACIAICVDPNVDPKSNP